MKLLLQGQKTPMNAANVQDGDLKKAIIPMEQYKLNR